VRAGDLPSVLVQQISSCLYEHKTLVPATLQALTFRQPQALEMLIPALEERHWRRRVAVHPGQDIWRGGWRYAEALLARQIRFLEWDDTLQAEAEHPVSTTPLRAGLQPPDSDAREGASGPDG
jgi:hypothetical protein